MRTWRVGDEEPEDHPSIVDEDSITWYWEEVDEDEYSWVQQGVTINGNEGLGPLYMTWPELLEEFGPVREEET